MTESARPRHLLTLLSSQYLQVTFVAEHDSRNSDMIYTPVPSTPAIQLTHHSQLPASVISAPGFQDWAVYYCPPLAHYSRTSATGFHASHSPPHPSGPVALNSVSAQRSAPDLVGSRLRGGGRRLGERLLSLPEHNHC